MKPLNRKTLYGFRKHRPIVGEVPHFAPSGAPPLGQNTETNVSFASQLIEPSACTARTLTVAASPLSPLSPFSPGAPWGPADPGRQLALVRPECLARPARLEGRPGPADPDHLSARISAACRERKRH